VRALVIAALSVLAAACGPSPSGPAAKGAPSGPAANPSRFEAVAAVGAAPDPARWCDAFFPADAAPLLTLPKTAPARAGGTGAATRAQAWTWINVWATWCQPCRHEMPVLLRWRDELQREGVPFDLVFLSIDDTAAVLQQFLAANPTTAPDPSVRLLAQRDLASWLGGYQRDPSTTIPIQVIAAPGNRVRCIRSGSLRDGDWPIVRALVK